MLITGLASLFFCGSFALDLVMKSAESRATTTIKTNRMRYASNEDSNPISMHMPELTSTSSSRLAIPTPYNSDSNDNYKQDSSSQFHEGKFLDDEDKRLLDQFYRENKKNDPFLGDHLSIESLWSDEQEKRDKDARLGKLEKPAKGDNLGGEQHDYDGWTFDARIIDGLNGTPFEYSLGPSLENNLKANYSPTLELLTSYNPTRDSGNTSDQQTGQMDLLKSSNRIVGATLFGRDQLSRPNVSSKSATDAIRLHNDMLKKPPNDGKVRVRMYYHRAIHDDAKLYGTGPWKYWGHGWGLEFGYDPRQKDKDFYQKGYTIERAFGRDFCKDNNNCRKSDPNFFKNPKNVGKYSEQYFKGIKKPKI